MGTHTPKPWVATGGYILAPLPDGEFTEIAECFGGTHDDETNAAHIVKCVNGWDEVAGALESLIDSLPPEAWEALPQYVQENAMAALTRAKGV